jgi:hypothetical protein
VNRRAKSNLANCSTSLDGFLKARQSPPHCERRRIEGQTRWLRLLDFQCAAKKIFRDNAGGSGFQCGFVPVFPVMQFSIASPRLRSPHLQVFSGLPSIRAPIRKIYLTPFEQPCSVLQKKSEPAIAVLHFERRLPESKDSEASILQAAPSVVHLRPGFLPPVEMTDEVLADSAENRFAHILRSRRSVCRKDRRVRSWTDRGSTAMAFALDSGGRVGRLTIDSDRESRWDAGAAPQL